MVAPAPQPDPEAPADLPPLTPTDANTLHWFFALGRCPFNLAAKLQQPLEIILAWLNLPHIRAHRREFAALQADSQKAIALDTLRQIAQTSESPTERRRAATTLLRALQPPRPVRPPSEKGADTPRHRASARCDGRTPTHPCTENADAEASVQPLLEGADGQRSSITSAPLAQSDDPAPTAACEPTNTLTPLQPLSPIEDHDLAQVLTIVQRDAARQPEPADNPCDPAPGSDIDSAPAEEGARHPSSPDDIDETQPLSNPTRQRSDLPDTTTSSAPHLVASTTHPTSGP